MPESKPNTSSEQPSSGAPALSAHETARAKKLPFASKFAYGLGGFAEHNINSMANPVLNVTLGVNPAMVGLLLAIPRIYDAFADPIMGGITDRCQSKYGRRKPFILIGGLLSAVLFFLMWQIPRGMGEVGYFRFPPHSLLRASVRYGLSPFR